MWTAVRVGFRSSGGSCEGWFVERSKRLTMHRSTAEIVRSLDCDSVTEAVGSEDAERY